jgi:hypothetical protein
MLEHCGRFIAIRLPDFSAESSVQYYAGFKARLVRLNATESQARKASERLDELPPHTRKAHKFKFFEVLGRIQRQEAEAETLRDVQGSFGGHAEIESAARKAWKALPEEEREKLYREAAERYPWVTSLSPARAHCQWSHFVLELAFDLYQQDYAKFSAPERQGALYEPAF